MWNYHFRCVHLLRKGVLEDRKNRIKGCLEGASGGSKSGVKPAENESEKTKKMVRGRAKCKRCGELGHRQASCKCPLNGTKKRKRKPRKNTTPTKGWTPKDSTPDRAVNTREQIMQESPRIALIFVDGRRHIFSRAHIFRDYNNHFNCS